MTPGAVIFDFNGTISDDEALLAELFERIFGEVGIDVPASLYFDEFAGYSDAEICERVLRRLGREGEAGLQERLIARRTASGSDPICAAPSPAVPFAPVKAS